MISLFSGYMNTDIIINNSEKLQNLGTGIQNQWPNIEEI